MNKLKKWFKNIFRAKYTGPTVEEIVSVMKYDNTESIEILDEIISEIKNDK